MLIRFAILLAILQISISATTVVVNAEDVDQEPTWRKIFDTVLYAGEKTEDWAIDEPIDKTIDRLRSVLKHEQCIKEAPKHEAKIANHIITIADAEDTCKLNAGRAVDKLIDGLMNESRRYWLHKANQRPKKLRLEDYMRELVDTMNDACKEELVPVIVEKNLELKKLNAAELINRLKDINLQTKNEIKAGDSNDEILEEIVDALAKKCTFNEGEDPSSQDGFKTVASCYFNQVANPCQKILEVDDAYEKIIIAGVSGSLGPLTPSIKDFFERRDVCKRYELAEPTIAGTVHARFVEKLNEGNIQPQIKQAPGFLASLKGRFLE